MIKSSGSIVKEKQRVRELFGKTVKVKLNLGRNKFAQFYGRIDGVYPALFTVQPVDGFTGKTSYSYSEMICGKVKITE